MVRFDPQEMSSSVRFRALPAPPSDLSDFDPGTYVAGLDVYDTGLVLTEPDRDGLAQFVHYVAFLALQARSSAWPGSTIPVDSSICRALVTHFAHLGGWNEIPIVDGAISFRAVVTCLMSTYPPHPPRE